MPDARTHRSLSKNRDLVCYEIEKRRKKKRRMLKGCDVEAACFKNVTVKPHTFSIVLFERKTERINDRANTRSTNEWRRQQKKNKLNDAR